MGFLTREKKDGKRTAGYGVYLIGALFALGSVVYLRRRLAEGAGAPRAKGGAPSNVAPITQPASTVSPIEVKDPHPPEGRVPSYRQDQNGGAHPAVKPAAERVERESFNTINLALQQAVLAPGANEGHGDRALDEGGGHGRGASAPSPFAELPPAFAPEGNVPAAESATRNTLLFGYRDGAADSSEVPAAASSANPAINQSILPPKERSSKRIS